MAKQEFPSKEDFIRLKNLKKYKDLYDGEHYKVFGIKDYFVDLKDKERKLYITTNITALISEYFADLVVGDEVSFISTEKDQQELLDGIIERNNIKVNIFESAITQSTFGFVPMRVRKDEEGNAVIEEVPVDQYFPEFSSSIGQEMNAVVLASFIKITDKITGKENDRLLKQIYEIDRNDVVTFKFELWSVDSKKVQKERVPLSEYDPDLSENPIIIEEINELPIVQINNIKSSGQLFGKSDYKDIQPLVQEHNDRVTHISVQLIKHMNARLSVPQGTLDDKGELRAAEVDMFEVGEGDTKPEYVTNNNPLIDKGFEQILQLLRRISAISKVPTDVLGIEPKGGVEKVEAMRLRLFNTTRKVARKRLYIEGRLKGILKMALQLEGIKDPADISIEWGDPLPEDELTKTTIAIDQIQGGVKSKRKAIKELQELTDEELDAELAEIEEGNKETVPEFATRTLPTLTPEQINEQNNA